MLITTVLGERQNPGKNQLSLCQIDTFCVNNSQCTHWITPQLVDPTLQLITDQLNKLSAGQKVMEKQKAPARKKLKLS